jgi:hypothetical protein
MVESLNCRVAQTKIWIEAVARQWGSSLGGDSAPGEMGDRGAARLGGCARISRLRTLGGLGRGAGGWAWVTWLSSPETARVSGSAYVIRESAGVNATLDWAAPTRRAGTVARVPPSGPVRQRNSSRADCRRIETRHTRERCCERNSSSHWNTELTSPNLELYPASAGGLNGR